MVLARLDIGTNTLRVLIRNGERELFRKNYYLFLGDEVIGGKLTLQGIKKLEKVLLEINQIFAENGVKDIFAVATAFARKLNCERELKDVFFDKLGIDIKIIDGKEEGSIVYNAIKRQFNIDDFSVFDIGGGSTEFIYKRGDNIEVESYEMGSLYLKRQFFQNFPPTSEEKNQFCKFVLKKLGDEIKHQISLPVYGVGGTVTTIAFILSGEKTYKKENIDGFVINRGLLERFYHVIEYLNPQKIKELYPIESGREEVLLSGVLLVLLIMNYLEIDNIIASDTSLLEGLFYLPTRKNVSSTVDRL